MTIPEKDLAEIAFGGLRSYLKEKLEGGVYYSINGLQLRAMSQETKFENSKDAYKPHRSMNQNHTQQYRYLNDEVYMHP